MHDQTALYYAESVLKLLVRAGVVDEADVLAVADEHDLLADRHPQEAEVRRDAAHQLRATLMDIDPPSAVEPASEQRAAFLRQQMVERTQLLSEGQ